MQLPVGVWVKFAVGPVEQRGVHRAVAHPLEDGSDRRLLDLQIYAHRGQVLLGHFGYRAAGLVAGDHADGEGELDPVFLADAVAVRVHPTGLLQQRLGLLGVVLVLLEVRIVIEIVLVRQVRVRKLGRAAPDIINDLLAVEGVHHRLAHPLVRELRE